MEQIDSDEDKDESDDNNEDSESESEEVPPRKRSRKAKDDKKKPEKKKKKEENNEGVGRRKKSGGGGGRKPSQEDAPDGPLKDAKVTMALLKKDVENCNNMIYTLEQMLDDLSKRIDNHAGHKGFSGILDNPWSHLYFHN